MQKNIDSLPGNKKKIGCAWNSEIGKVVGHFIVTPIEKTNTQKDNRNYYFCEFKEMVFIRVIGGEKYNTFSELPEKLKKEVSFLIGSKKTISSDVLNNGTLVYTERPGP